MEVLDFYTQEKNVFRANHLTAKDAHFSILVKMGKIVKELTIFIPKRYSYILKLWYGKHNYVKVREYNILMDYLLHNKKTLMKKWDFTEDTFYEFLLHIRLCLDLKYANCNLYKRGVLICKSIIKLLNYKLVAFFKR